MKKILLVDDDESIQLLYREELEDAGFQVISAISSIIGRNGVLSIPTMTLR